jgi:hypothetical protein
MSVTLNENASLATPTKKGNKWSVKVIEAGWGSSGYYGADMLAEYGPQVFKAGTKVFMNHPSATESSDRPERDVHQLAGKLTSDAVFSENGLVAEIEFYSHYAPIIKEMAGDVGLSIHALGNATVGEAEGRQGPIIESLVSDPMTSVDVVTVAGAGGKFLNLLESYTRKDTETTPVAESVSEGNGMSITKEEFESAIAELKTAFVEALTPVVESVSILAEAAKPAEIVEGEEAVEELAEALNPVDVALQFNESGLPQKAIARVAETLKSETNEKTVAELIEAEQAYVAEIAAEVAAVETPATEDTTGVIQEANKSSLVDEWEAVTSRITGVK